MIKYINNSLLFIFIALSFSNLNAQNNSGIITYKGVMNEKFVDSFLIDIKQQNIDMAVKQKVVEMFNNAKPDEFILNFKSSESYYYKNPTLDNQEGYNMGSRSGVTPYYTSNATDSIIEMSQYLGNIVYTPLDWEITNETKAIGDFTCYQAVATEKLYNRQEHFDYKKVIAWFVPTIPLNFGPKYYKGLPGLILEIDRDEFTLTAIKLNLNPKDEDIKIKRLGKNDKVITQEESYKRIAGLEADRKKRMKADKQ